MPSREFIIVTACTVGKRVFGERIALRQFIGNSPQERFGHWWGALQRTPQTVPVLDLYLGDHWTVSRKLVPLMEEAGFSASLWVTSAGYGLIPVGARLCPYSATFASGQPDSVSQAIGDAYHQDLRCWWSLLCGKSLSGHAVPRSIAGLANENPRRGILVIASRSYVLAMQDDLFAARAALRPPADLLIVSSPSAGFRPDLLDALVPSTARLQAIVGGPRQALHARVARWLIEHTVDHDFRSKRVCTLIDQMTQDAPELPIYGRASCTDAEVCAFIRKVLRKDYAATASALLRGFRASGCACEQGRFRRLFNQVKNEVP